MTSRRDWQLQQLGITQWALRRPGATGRDCDFPSRARSSDRGCRGITRAERAANARYFTRVDRESRSGFTLAPERVAMLPQGSRCNSWRLGTDAPLQLEGAQVTTPAFNELRANPAARAALWQQICEHEHDFYPQHDRSPRSLAD